MDDPYMSCPYEPTHRVPRSRIQAHIIRCQSKHPNYMVCPYNATHRLPHSELKAHVQKCPSRNAILPDEKPPKITAQLTTPRPILQKEYLPETDPNHETWDD